MLLSINSSVQSIGLTISLLALAGLVYWIYQIWVKEIKGPGLSFDQVMATKGPTLFKAIGALSTIAEVIGLAIIGMMHPDYPMNPFSAFARYGSLGLMEASANFFFQAVVAARITRYVADGKFTWLEKLKSVLLSIPWFIIACMATHLIAILYTESTNAFHIAFSGSIGTPWTMFRIVVTDPTGMVGMVRLDASALIMIYISQFIDILMVLVMFRVPEEEWKRQAVVAKAAGILPTAPTAPPTSSTGGSAAPSGGSTAPSSTGSSAPLTSSPTPPPAPSGSSTAPPPPASPPRTSSPDLAIYNNPKVSAFITMLERMFSSIFSPNTTVSNGGSVSFTLGNNPATPTGILDIMFTLCGLTGYTFSTDSKGSIVVNYDNLQINSDLSKANPDVKSYLEALLNQIRTSVGTVTNTMISSSSVIQAAHSITLTGNQLSPVKMAEKFIKSLYDIDNMSAASQSDFGMLSTKMCAIDIIRSSAKDSIVTELSTIASNIRSGQMFGFLNISSSYDLDIHGSIESDNFFQQLPSEIKDWLKYHTISLFYAKGNPTTQTRAYDNIKGILVLMLESYLPKIITEIENDISNNTKIEVVYDNLIVLAMSVLITLKTTYPLIVR